MKTKTIFKALALAMLMPATMLNTACSSEDDAIINNDETPAKKSYTLPLTINVTREGDDATTRATYNESTKKLSFSTGDKLLVTGYYGSNWDSFAGTLEWVSEGTFSGTITTENGWDGTALELLEAAASDCMAPSATLLPAGYDDPYSFLSINNPGTCNAYVGYNFKKAFATSKAAAVAQFSFEQGDYTSGTGFVLHPSSAILNFTITGLTPNTNVTASLEEEWGGELVSGAVTTDGDGTATFAMGVKYGNKNALTLTVDGNAITITSSDKTLERGHVYNWTNVPAGPTAYTLAESTQGMIVGTDGLAYDVADKDNLPTGVTAAGVVVYKNGANGLAIALEDEASMMDWATAKGASGAAAHTPTVEGQTWKLPSQEEWTLVKNANSGSSLNSAITNAGGTAIPTVHFDHETGTTTGKYWLSTEGGFAEAARTWGINGYDEIAVDSQDFKTSNNLVRACLAW